MSAVHIVKMDQFSVRLNIIKLFNNLLKILKLSMKDFLFKPKNTHSYYLLYRNRLYPSSGKATQATSITHKYNIYISLQYTISVYFL